MKVVINKCYGGFSLSPLAMKEIAEAKGERCYFFAWAFKGGKSEYTPITLEQAESTIFWSAFTIANPDDLELDKRGENGLFTEANKKADEVKLDNRPDNRRDPILISVIEKLGEKANGAHAELAIVEIPDDISYEIQKCDGWESIHETHRSWS